MNNKIMELAISRVKSLILQIDGKCEICHKNTVEYKAEEIIEIKGMPTEVGIPTCRTCFDNIQIVIGELSEEY